MIILDGKTVHELVLEADRIGCWVATCLVDAETMEGKLTLDVDGVSFVGTVVRQQLDASGLQVQLVGGAGWSTILPSYAYAVNDAGTKTRLVIEDIARVCGETLGTVEPGRERVGSHYCRRSGPASVTLEDCCRGSDWWVEYDGRTFVGQRASRQLANEFEVIDYDRDAHELVVTADTADAVLVGDSLTHEILTEPFVVESLVLRWDPERRLEFTLRGHDDHDVYKSVEKIVQQILGKQLLAAYEYRVVGQSNDRLDLQAVERGTLPDLARVRVWPGIAGVRMAVTNGTRVLVQFIAGDPSKPVVTSFVDANGGNFSPNIVTFTSDVAAEGDIEADGDISADGEVAANALLPTTIVRLTKHVHVSAAPGNPTLPPTVPEPAPP